VRERERGREKEEDRKKRPCSVKGTLMNGERELFFSSRISVTTGEFNFHRTKQTMF